VPDPPNSKGKGGYYTEGGGKNDFRGGGKGDNGKGVWYKGGGKGDYGKGQWYKGSGKSDSKGDGKGGFKGLC
jgi:hypothetical protein